MPPFASDFLRHHVATALGISAKATLSPGPQGMTSEVAFVDDQGRHAVLKRCRDPCYIEWLRREQHVLRALSECPLRIPRVLGYHEVHDGEHITETWLLMTRLPGEPLWDVLLRSAPSPQQPQPRRSLPSQIAQKRHNPGAVVLGTPSSPADRSHLFGDLGNLLRQLHSMPPPQAFRGQAPWLDRMLQHARKNLAWCDRSPELLARLEATRPEPIAEVLIHGDVSLDNVLIAPNGNLSLIDWPTGDLGDPRSDIAIALATEPEIHLSGAEIAAFYEAYGGKPMDAPTRKWFVGLYEFF
jgi:aminoglycoside phosphotransferase (APT) family kinase protein